MKKGKRVSAETIKPCRRPSVIERENVQEVSWRGNPRLCTNRWQAHNGLGYGLGLGRVVPADLFHLFLHQSLPRMQMYQNGLSEFLRLEQSTACRPHYYPPIPVNKESFFNSIENTNLYDEG
jgi:hypothetical protein